MKFRLVLYIYYIIYIRNIQILKKFLTISKSTLRVHIIQSTEIGEVELILS